MTNSPLKPLRSALFVPASRPRAIEKAAGLGADMLILDLEDAVGPDEKEEGRAAIPMALDAWAGSGAIRAVRINGLDTPWAQADISAAARADAFVLPKIEDKSALLEARSLINAFGSHAPIWAMIETPASLMNLAGIVSATGSGLAGLIAGTNDLCKSLGCSPEKEREALIPHLAAIVCAARTKRLYALDGVYNAFADAAGFKAECEQGKRLGFDGKSLIHPGQVDPANQAFAPDAEALQRARAIVEAFADPNNAGKGVISLEGDMVERLHLDAARQLLASAGGNDA